MLSARAVALLGLAQLFTTPALASRREFDLDVTWEDHAPDGSSARKMLLINGQTPGPQIRVGQDDWVVVRLCNSSPYNQTIHFHGIEMYNTPWSDGVPGVSQRAIQPGETFTYEWEATQYGAYWYHSHFKGQIEDGLYGPITIHPRGGDPKPFSMISSDPSAVKAMELAESKVSPLMVADFSQLTSAEKFDITLKAQLEDSCYDSILFNGKGRVECVPADELAAQVSPPQASWFALVPGSTFTDKGCIPANVVSVAEGYGNPSVYPPGIYTGCHATEGSTEVINALAGDGYGSGGFVAIDVYGSVNFVTGIFSIDEHDMWVYAMDGSYITPQKVQGISVTNGDRYSVMVQPKKAGDFQMRYNVDSVPQLLEGHAILRITGGGKPSNSTSTPYISLNGTPLSPDVVLFNQSIAAPFPPEPIAQEADQFIRLTMVKAVGEYLWAMNDTRLPSSVLDTETPVLFKPDFFVQNNVTISTLNDTWVDLLLIATPGMPPHPIHKHNNKMFQIGAGDGNFTWNSVTDAMKDIPGQFNLVNPPRRDAFASAPTTTDYSWTVVRYHVVNPGAWLLHCHIATHMVSGMMMVIQDGVDHWPTVPSEYLNF